MSEVLNSHGYFDRSLERYLDVEIPTKVGHQTLASLLAEGVQHPFMQDMHNQHLRLADLRYNRTQKLEDLGGNIEPVYHGIHAMRFAAATTMAGRIDRRAIASDEDVAVGLLADMFHDVGESESWGIKKELGFVLGDIPHGKKTDKHRDMEQEIYKFALPRMLPQLSQETIDTMWDIASHADKTMPTWKTYKAGHVLGELDPGIALTHRVFGRHVEGLNNELMPKRLRNRLRQQARMANEIFKNHIKLSEDWAKEFTLIAQLVDKDYKHTIQWHRETGGFGYDDELGLVVVPDGYEEVLEKDKVVLPRGVGDLRTYGYGENRKELTKAA